MEITKNLGDRLRTLRKTKGYTQENVADMLQISSTAYAKIERGETDISLSRMAELAKVFDTTPEKLLSEETNTFIFSNFSNSTAVGNGSSVLNVQTLKEEEIKLMLMSLKNSMEQLLY